MEAFWNCK